MKTLLASDGSEYSKGAAKFLTCLNLFPEDEITVFHAVYWIPFLYNTESYFETFREIKKEIAPRIIDSALEILKPVHAKISTAIMEGSPVKSPNEITLIKLIKRMLKNARKKKYIEENPAEELDLPKKNSPEIEILTPAEITLFIEKANKHYRVAFLTGFLTGTRAGELWGLQWGDIDWNSKQIYVRRSLWKGQAQINNGFEIR